MFFVPAEIKAVIRAVEFPGKTSGQSNTQTQNTQTTQTAEMTGMTGTTVTTGTTGTTNPTTQNPYTGGPGSAGSTGSMSNTGNSNQNTVSPQSPTTPLNAIPYIPPSINSSGVGGGSEVVSALKKAGLKVMESRKVVLKRNFDLLDMRIKTAVDRLKLISSRIAKATESLANEGKDVYVIKGFIAQADTKIAGI